MDANEYQKLAARTLIDEPDTMFTNEELAIMLAALELGAAVGKVLEYVKKGICHRHGFDMHELRKKLYDVSAAAIFDTYKREYHLSGNEQMLIWCALGIGGEAGEVMETIAEMPGCAVDSTSVLVKEQGDCAWYLAGLATLIGVPLSEVFDRNIAKLVKRYPNGYGSEASKARVDIA